MTAKPRTYVVTLRLVGYSSDQPIFEHLSKAFSECETIMVLDLEQEPYEPRPSDHQAVSKIGR